MSFSPQLDSEAYRTSVPTGFPNTWPNVWQMVNHPFPNSTGRKEEREGRREGGVSERDRQTKRENGEKDLMICLS